MYFWDVPPAWKYTWVCLRMGYTMIYRYAHDGGPFHRANAEQILINQRILNDGTMGSPKKNHIPNAFGGRWWLGVNYRSDSMAEWMPRSNCSCDAWKWRFHDGFMMVSWWPGHPPTAMQPEQEWIYIWEGTRLWSNKNRNLGKQQWSDLVSSWTNTSHKCHNQEEAGIYSYRSKKGDVRPRRGESMLKLPSLGPWL
jgi:hypothetical protein